MSSSEPAVRPAPSGGGSSATQNGPGSPGRRLRVLIVTKIFPNAIEPSFAPYNVQQFSRLAEHCDVALWAPVPWLPFAEALGGRSRAGVLAGLPRAERIADLVVEHPRVLHTPKLHALLGPAYAASLLPAVPRLRGRIDVVLGAFAYPDGWAAIVLAKLLGAKSAVKLHGGDVNMVAKLPGPRRHLQAMLPRADRIVAVSRPLADEVQKLGARPDRIDVVRNGVDKSVFYPRDRAACRQELDLPADKKLLVYVGRLERRKGVFELIEAFLKLAPEHPDVDLVLVGNGDDAEACARETEPVRDRVHYRGAQPLEGVALHIGASDVLTLPSHAEGTPNVLIEALSSGRRVVATDVGGIPDVVDDPVLGELVPAMDAPKLADALARAAHQGYDPSIVAARGGREDWAESGRALFEAVRRAAEAA